MKKIEKKALKEKLLSEVKKVIEDNNACYTKKTEMEVKKSIKQIVNKTAKKSKPETVN